MKYKPQTKEELQKLVQDESIYLGDIDTSLITDMSELFQNSKRVNFEGLETWNTSNVVNMSSMFELAENFNYNINSWDVSKVENMSKMFWECKKFNQPLNKWNISNVNNVQSMFGNCSIFNQNIENWNTSNIKIFSFMFYNCLNFNQPLGKWDTSNVINTAGMFMNCRNFNQNINNWNVSKLEYANSMFYNCLNFNQPLGKWDTSNVISTAGMFMNCRNFNQNINNWNVSKLEYANSMFEECWNFNQPLDNWKTSNLKYVSNMFKFCYEFNQPLNTWDTSKIIEMDYVFHKAEKFNQPLNTWKVDKVENMIGMLFRSGFEHYDSLSNWELESMEYMGDWFDAIDKHIDKFSLKWILYLYAFDNNTESIERKLKENIKEIHKIASEIKNKKVQSAKRKLENIYYDELKEFIDYKIFDTIEEYEESIKLSKKDEKKVSYIENANVFIKDKSRTADEKIIKYIYLKYLELKRDIYNLLEIDSIINLLDRESFLTFAKNIYIETHKETAAIVYSLYGSDEALREIYKKEKDSNFFLIILSSVKRTEYSIKLLYD
ncbi:BspA family leucine-rich repeat surface protein, partial [Brachyspira pulli]